MKYIIGFLLAIVILYSIIGWKKIFKRYGMFLDKNYWTDYNSLVFGIELWYLHFLTLITSALLIWASMKKNLPTLIAFNTIWICISLTIIIRNIW